MTHDDGMNILSDERHQVLTFVDACNRNGYNPTGEQVMLWLQNPEPAEATYRIVEVPPVMPDVISLIPNTGVSEAVLALGRMHDAALPIELKESLNSTLGRMVSRMYAEHAGADSLGSYVMRKATTKRELVKEAESIIDHLVRLTWLQTVPRGADVGLRLTDLGRALLRDRDQELIEDDVAVSVVVLSAADPLSYARLVGHLADAGAGLLVDPYLKIDGLHMIVNSTRLTRLLVLANERNTRELAAMEIYLNGRAQGGPGLNLDFACRWGPARLSRGKC